MSVSYMAKWIFKYANECGALCRKVVYGKSGNDPNRMILKWMVHGTLDRELDKQRAPNKLLLKDLFCP